MQHPLIQTPSVQDVPSGAEAFGGHVALVPVQFSAASQSPVEERHSTVEDWNVSAGQSLLVPSQLSATSQSPCAWRQTAVLFTLGHKAIVPEQ